MTDYQQGSTHRAADYGAPLLGVDPSNLYTAVGVDSAGRLLASPQQPTLQDSADLHAPAANTGAVVTYAAPGLGLAHAIDGLLYSATGTIAAAVVASVKDGTTVVLSWGVGGTGPQQLNFPSGLRTSADAAMVLTLPALGASGTGTMAAIGHRVVVVSASARYGLLDFRQPGQSQYVPLFF